MRTETNDFWLPHTVSIRDREKWDELIHDPVVHAGWKAEGTSKGGGCWTGTMLLKLLFFSLFIINRLTWHLCIDVGGAGRSVTWTLQQALKVHCGSHHMTATLPRPMSEALGVVAIWLSDQSCVGKRNATHWTVRTHVTSCSSTSRIDGKLTSYSNVVCSLELDVSFPDSSTDFCLFFCLRFTSNWPLRRATTKILKAPDSMAMRLLLVLKHLAVR